MDRNTLLAFFLISLVLVFTPKYMELVSPPSQDSPSDSTISETKEQTSSPFLKEEKNATPLLRQIKPSTDIKQTKEEIFVVDTDLYTATVSSRGGGTIKNFRLNNYFGPDSQRVDLINLENQANLLISAKNLDGDSLTLASPWELDSKQTRSRNSDVYELVFKKQHLSFGYIYKTLTFLPNTYIIEVSVDLSEIKNEIYRDVSFGWFGGLSTTEKNKIDDQTYFKSYVYQGEELEELKNNEKERLVFNGPTDWVAIRTKYFASAIIPKDPSKTRGSTLLSTERSKETYSAGFVFDVNNKGEFLLYLGPLEYDRIKSLNVGLDNIMDFGWAFIRPISKGVLYALKEMHQYIPNYGFVLIVFSFLVKILVYPLTKKSYQSTAAMQTVQPEINKLREKYKSDPNKLNQATMKLYKEKGVNPLGGCLPMLLQMPLLFALFIVFRTTIELRAEPFIFWIKDLSSPDFIFSLPFSLPIYGQHVAVLPILMVVSMYVQQKMMTGVAQQPQQKTMQYFMTGFFFLIFNTFPSGLNLYYTLFNVLTIAQQKLVPSEK